MIAKLTTDWQLPLDEVRRMFDVNVFGTLEVAQKFMGELRKAAGRLVVVGSLAGLLSPPFFGACPFASH